MNIPNRITISRILLIPIFILLLSLPLNWGNWQIGESTLPIADFAAAILFIFASVTDW